MFNLNIWHYDANCTVQLAWGERQQLSASLKYPAHLIQLYQNWQQCYRRAYPALMRGRGEDFSFTPAAVDWKHETEKAEKDLLHTFEWWLGGEELLAIRQKIQREAQRSDASVDLLVACNSMDLVKLPWEAWQLGPKDRPLANLRISRTLLDMGEEPVWVEPKPKRGIPRILVILGDGSELNLQADRKAVRVLQKVAKVEFIQFESKGKGDGETRGWGDAETRRRGDTETPGHEDTETQGHGDVETRRHGDTETRGRGDAETDMHGSENFSKEAISYLLPPVPLLGGVRGGFLLGGVRGGFCLLPPTLEEIADFRQRLNDAIADERGWDMLIFAGHSRETSLMGGIIQLAPQVFLSISEIESALLQAQERGLQVAIFNSCNGLSIAESLIKLGCPQVVVMREAIHDGVAQVFLKQLCYSLATYQDLQQAMLDACRYCESEKLSYPSAYLIPSLFRHPSFPSTLFQFERSHWKRWWRDWQPSPREAIAFSATVLLSLMVPVQDLLLDLRTLTQAFYRQQTHQLPSNPQPSVLLVAVDQESLNQGKQSIEQFETNPIDREYLAQLVNRLQKLNVKTAGIDYILDTPEPKQGLLAKEIRSTVTKVGTWLVFAVNQTKQLEVLPQIAQMSWSFGGDTEFFSWDVQFPEDATCSKKCPFAYSIALAHTLNQEDSLPRKVQPRLENRGELQQKVSTYLQQEPQLIASLAKQVDSPLGLRSIIDFSLPPQETYQSTPAQKFLKGLKENFPQIQEQVVIIAAGGYDEADDNFSMPLALRYWCRVENIPARENYRCPESFTGGEAHAYMVHHLLSQHQVRLIPDWWVIVLAALLGKGITLILLQQKQQRRRQWGKRLVIATAISGIVSLQVYVSSLLLIPWFLPSVVFLVYFAPVLRKNIYG
ncbi:MAG: CHASE2 domain-containing protein [Symploca sp. SIO2E6]|nr:CHASE2 domain-containing protein [Symploca sp. SIO2E6]